MDGINKLVLYVDDDADDRMLMVEALEVVTTEYQFITAQNGPEALMHLRETKEKPGLVILDLNMPGMNGMEVLQEIKSDDTLRNIPVVVFTTSPNPADQKACAVFGVDMITKPISFKGLTETVRKMLDLCI